MSPRPVRSRARVGSKAGARAHVKRRARAHEAKAARSAPGRRPGLRVGHGFDMHRLVAGRSLRLGGVDVPHKRGLEGHSDGDCVLHAVCDALLGAAAAGDLGRHFPSSDPRWRGADSRSFVLEASRIVREAGWLLANLDVTVVAQEPALAPYLEPMRAALAGMLGSAPGSVSVKAKSADHLGAIGRGEGIAALATALLIEEERPKR